MNTAEISISPDRKPGAFFALQRAVKRRFFAAKNRAIRSNKNASFWKRSLGRSPKLRKPKRCAFWFL
jgi:hypothetical protein